MTSLRRRERPIRGQATSSMSRVGFLEVTPFALSPDRVMTVVRGETRNHHCEVVQIFTRKLVVPRHSVTTEGLPIEQT